MPDQKDNKPQSTDDEFSQYAKPAEDEFAQYASPATQSSPYGWQGAVDIGKGLGESIVQTGHGIGTLARRAIEQGAGPQMAEHVIPQTRLDQLQQLATPTDPTQRGVKFGGQALQFLALPGGSEVGAAGAATRIAGAGTLNMLQDPKVSGGAFLTGAAGGALGEIPGLAAKYGAAPYAESRLGGADRGVWKTGQIGREFLDQGISGLTPRQIEANTNVRIEQLKAQRNALVDQATQQGKLGTTTPAQQVLQDAINKWPKNDRAGLDDLDKLWDSLHFGPAGVTGPGARGQRIFTPNDLASMKEGIGNQISDWGPRMKSSPAVTKLEKDLYRAIDNQLDQLAPGHADLNDSISKLSPMARRARVQQSQASTIQNILAKGAVHTGALAAGAHYGLLTPEGAATVIIPELIATPTGRMIGAKGLNLATRPVPRYVIPRATAAGISYLSQQ